MDELRRLSGGAHRLTRKTLGTSLAYSPILSVVADGFAYQLAVFFLWFLWFFFMGL